MSPSPGTSSPAVVRAAAILDVIASNSDEAIRVADISRTLGFPASSTTNILSALVETGLARRVGSGYTIGPVAVELASRFLQSDDPIQRFRAFVPETTHLSAETVQLATLQTADALFLARHDGAQPIALTSGIGKRLPASSTAIGKAMLAQLDVSELTAILPRPLVRLTDRSHSDLGSLLVDLEATRERGYAIDDEEAAPNVICLAVAVEPGDDEPMYAISTTLFKERLTPELRSGLIADLEVVASYLSK